MVARTYSPEPVISPEQYLERERAAGFKSEFYDRQIYAMAGASKEHTRIVTSTLVSLGAQLRGTTCEPFAQDMRVNINALGDYFYPDIAVACEPEFTDDKFDTLANPRVIIEVLSPSTAGFDRDEKFKSYQAVPSLTDYILIAQSEPRVEHFARQSDDSWLLRIAKSLDAEIEIASIGCILKLREIYERVPFADAPRESTPE